MPPARQVLVCWNVPRAVGARVKTKTCGGAWCGSEARQVQGIWVPLMTQLQSAPSGLGSAPASAACGQFWAPWPAWQAQFASDAWGQPSAPGLEWQAQFAPAACGHSAGGGDAGTGGGSWGAASCSWQGQPASPVASSGAAAPCGPAALPALLCGGGLPAGLAVSLADEDPGPAGSAAKACRWAPITPSMPAKTATATPRIASVMACSPCFPWVSNFRRGAKEVAERAYY